MIFMNFLIRWHHSKWPSKFHKFSQHRTRDQDFIMTLNERYHVSNHRKQDCLLLTYQRKHKKTSRCWSFVRGIQRWSPSQRASNAETTSVLWRHQDPKEWRLCCKHGFKWGGGSYQDTILCNISCDKRRYISTFHFLRREVQGGVIMKNIGMKNKCAKQPDKKMSPPRGDLKSQPSDSCWML